VYDVGAQLAGNGESVAVLSRAVKLVSRRGIGAGYGGKGNGKSLSESKSLSSLDIVLG